MARVRQVTARGLRPRAQPRHVHDSEPAGVRHATWLELFFDLAFVVAVARLAVLLHDDHDLGGFFTFAGLFVIVWWAWISYSHFADLFDEDRPLDRLGQLSAMLGAVVVAVALADGVTADSAVLAVVFAAMFTLLAGLYAHAGWTEPAARELCGWFVAGSTVGASCWLASLAVPAPGRFWLWAVAVVANAAISGPIAYARMSAPPHQVSHMPERFGLFAIVVLGESVLAVVSGIQEAHWETAGVVTAVSGFVVAASIWWVYFADFDEAVIDRAIAGGRGAQLRAFLYAYGHLLVYVAIAGSGVGVELAIEASVEGVGPALLLPGALTLLVVGFVVVGAGMGYLGSPIHLAVKLGVVVAGLLAAWLVDDAAVVTAIVALGWAGLAVYKSMYRK